MSLGIVSTLGLEFLSKNISMKDTIIFKLSGNELFWIEMV